MGKMIAKALEGQEFLYNPNTAHEVPKSSAKAICAALNEAGYKLKPGEVWHVYDCDEYTRRWTNAGALAFAKRNGYVVEIRRSAR